jgi:hypothetical protein
MPTSMQPSRSLLRALALCVALTGLVACSGGTPGARPVIPTTIEITSGDIVLSSIGETATVTAVVLDRIGTPIPSAVVSFSSADPSVATVSSTGLVTATGDGATTVTARSGALAASVSVSVQLGNAGTVTIRKSVQAWYGGVADNPANPTLAGFEFEIRPLGGGTPVGTAATDASGVARVNAPPGDHVVIESNSLGLTNVTAAFPITVVTGESVEVDWVNRQASRTSAPVGIIEASPRAVPSGDNGQTEVRLYAGNSADPNGDVLTYLWNAPGGTILGSDTSAFARVTYPGGSTRTVSLTVNDGAGNQDFTQLQIAGASALPAPGTFDIELIPIEPITDPEAQAAFALAEATWESIIRGELPDVSVNLTASQVAACFDGAPAVNTTIDDVRIYVEFSDIDGPGGTLATAGPCFVRAPPGGVSTPIFGVMRFDATDFGNQPAATLNRVILHEMAHVLGFGTLWPRNELLEDPSCPDTNGDAVGDCSASDPPGPDTRFVGLEGGRAYRALGGPLNAGVPVENGDSRPAGPGSRDGHWRESVFATELMTGFIQSNTANPLSLLTVAALIDMGYEVDFAGVDDYSIPGHPPFPAIVAEPGDGRVIDLRGDVRSGPIFEIGPDGTLTRVDLRR